jgi:hypothetical protein
VGDKELTPGIIDDIRFGGITTNQRILVPEMLKILNEIKEAFSAARYLLFISKIKDKLLDSISETTIYFNNNDFSINGIYTGICCVFR